MDEELAETLFGLLQEFEEACRRWREELIALPPNLTEEGLSILLREGENLSDEEEALAVALYTELLTVIVRHTDGCSGWGEEELRLFINQHCNVDYLVD